MSEAIVQTAVTKQQVVAIVGPTASGKTELAIAVARQLGGELVSVDSRQVFRHCDIGTNKPTAAELGGIDPAAADRTQGNPRRLIRALEIYAATGRTPTEARESNPPPWSTMVLGLDVPLAELDHRIEMRVRRMIDAGFVDEVARIRRDFPAADLRRLGHGYPEMAASIDGGSSLEPAVESTVRQVRQYAPRHLTWIRAAPRVSS